MEAVGEVVVALSVIVTMSRAYLHIHFQGPFSTEQ